MFARWDRMAKQFARISKDINMAVKAGGADPNSNPALRRAVQNSRNLNMPKDKVEAAIKRASGKDATAYEQIIYEGYAPHGVAVIVEAATDNPTRTVAQVRAIFSKGGGNLGTAGSVAFQFRKMGVFRLKPEGIDHDDLELYLIDHGLDEMGDSVGDKGEPQIVARCHVPGVRPHAGGAREARHPSDLGRARIHLHHAGGTARSAGHRSARAHRHARAE